MIDGGEIINKLLKFAGQAGLNLIRSRLIAVVTKIIQGLRFLLLVQYSILISCFLASLGFFFGLYLVTNQLSEQKTLSLTWPLGLCWGLFLVFFGILLFSLREKTWLKAFQLDEWLEEALETPSQPTISAEDFERVIERVVEEKLKEESRRQSRRRPGQPAKSPKPSKPGKSKKRNSPKNR